MNYFKDVLRRLFVLFVIICGCLALGQITENYIVAHGFSLKLAGPVNACLVLLILIKTTSYLKFERIR